MKKLLTLLLTSWVFISTTVANDLFLYDAAEKVELADVISNKLVSQATTIGKTYTLTNNLSVSTSTNATATYALPYRIAVHQKENSAAYFNATPIEYINTFKLPEVVKVKDSQFNFSAQGEFYVVSDSAKQTTIGTSMSLIVFEKATLFVKAGDKFTHVYVVDGKATVLDNKSSKKKKELKAGDYLVITPQASLSPKEASVRNLGNSFSIKEVEDVEKDAHAAELKSLQTKLDNVLFVNYDANVFGVKFK
jgi:plastocyanin